MNEVIKTPGKHIVYDTTSKSIIFGEDEDLSINLKNREQDETTLIDICSDSDGFLVVGTGGRAAVCGAGGNPGQTVHRGGAGKPELRPGGRGGDRGQKQDHCCKGACTL